MGTVATLLDDMVQAMVTSIADTGQLTIERTESGAIRVYTRQSRDSRLSGDGGDYTYWRQYRVTGDGVQATDDWSSWYDMQAEPMTWPVQVSLDRLADLAERRALAQVAGAVVPACPCCGRP